MQRYEDRRVLVTGATGGLGSEICQRLATEGARVVVARRIGFRRRWYEGLLLTRTAPYGALRHEIDCDLDLAQAGGWPVAREDVQLVAPAETAFEGGGQPVVLINSGGDNANESSQVRRI